MRETKANITCSTVQSKWRRRVKMRRSVSSTPCLIASRKPADTTAACDLDKLFTSILHITAQATAQCTRRLQGQSGFCAAGIRDAWKKWRSGGAMLAGSCWERACAITRSKNVAPPLDEMCASPSPTRWTPRRHQGPTASRREFHHSASAQWEVPLPRGRLGSEKRAMYIHFPV